MDLHTRSLLAVAEPRRLLTEFAYFSFFGGGLLLTEFERKISRIVTTELDTQICEVADYREACGSVKRGYEG